MGKRRLPWKRGPAAWTIASNSQAVKARLASQSRSFLSLRQTARILGVSTQPVRDWVRLKHLRRDGPRAQFARAELGRFIRWLEKWAAPFPAASYAKRFVRKTDRSPRPFDVLQYAQFLWPKGRKALTPRELANLIGCHPSIIVKAVNHYWPSLGRRKSPHRWEISRNRWQNIFIFFRISEPRLPPFPRQRLFSITEAMEVLQRWGLRDISVHRVRQMIRCGELEGVARLTGKRKWLVTRKSMGKIQKSLLTE
jgi:hypothetical protein